MLSLIMKSVEEKIDALEVKANRILMILEDDPRIDGQIGLVSLALKTNKSMESLTVSFAEIQSEISSLEKANKSLEQRLRKVEKDQSLRIRVKAFFAALFGGAGVAAGYKFGPEAKAILNELFKLIFKY